MIKTNFKQLLSFMSVGGVGFLVDGFILTVLTLFFSTNVFLARLFSFFFASLVTWQLNRRYTFRVHDENEIPRSEYVRYLSIQSTGAVINLIIFSLVLKIKPTLETLPIIPLAIGSAFALMFNFIGTRTLFFRK